MIIRKIVRVNSPTHTRHGHCGWLYYVDTDGWYWVSFSDGAEMAFKESELA